MVKRQPEVDQTTLFGDEDEDFIGRDELNFAEFPISLLVNRINPAMKTIEFRKSRWCKDTRRYIDRTLVITGSDKFGLPTAADSNVIFALQQLSFLKGFSSPNLQFTRYELLQWMGKGTSGREYQRIQESLDRWCGVTFYWKNAWRRKDGTWENRNFHIIEDLSYTTKESQRTGQKCSLKWNDFVFKNFQDGHIRQVNYNEYMRLETDVAQRMFRFLGSKFYNAAKYHNSTRLKFDLKNFAYNDVGISRNHKDAAQIRRKLNQGIKELEEIQFLVPMSEKRRYKMLARGVWEVHFQAHQEESQISLIDQSEIEEIEPLERALRELGMDNIQAKKALNKHRDNPEFVQTQIEILRFELARGKQVSNPGGWLYTALLKRKNGFQPPDELLQQNQELEKQQELDFERRANEEVRLKAWKKYIEIEEDRKEKVDEAIQLLSHDKYLAVKDRVIQERAKGLNLSSKTISVLIEAEIAKQLESSDSIPILPPEPRGIRPKEV